jgi:hypothetical protein
MYVLGDGVNLFMQSVSTAQSDIRIVGGAINPKCIQCDFEHLVRSAWAWLQERGVCTQSWLALCPPPCLQEKQIC